MSVITETVKLVDGISGPSKTAAGNVKSLENQMTVLKSALKSTQDAMIKAQATGNTKQFASLQKAAQQYKVSLGQVDEQMKATGGSSASMQAELAEVTGGLSVVAEVAAGVVAAFGAVVIAGMAMTLEAVEAKEKMLALFDALGGGAISGKETVAMLDQIGDRFGQTRAQLAPIAQGFLTLGVTGKQALNDLTIAAASAGALAEGGAAAFTKMYGVINAAAETGSKLSIPVKKLESQLKGVGLNIGDLAKKMNMTEAALAKGLKAGTVDAKAFGDALTGAATDKGAGPLAQQGLTIGNIWAKAQESVMKMFEDIDVKPFLAEIKSLFDILGTGAQTGKASGQALKTGIGGFFKDVFALATKVVPYIKHFLLDLVILGLKAYIGLRPIVAWVMSLRQNTTVVAVFWAALKGLGKAAEMIGVALVVVVAVVGAFAAALIGIQVAIVAVGGIIFDFVADALGALTGFFGKAPQMAKDFIMGLADGIKNGAGMVVDAVKGMASGAVDSFKGALGIHSPSKVMMQMGGHVAAGAAAGIDDGAPDVHGASADLAKAASGGFASGGAAPAAGGASGGGSGGINVVLETGAIVIQGAGKGVEELTEQAVSLIFERIALQQGLG